MDTRRTQLDELVRKIKAALPEAKNTVTDKEKGQTITYKNTRSSNYNAHKKFDALDSAMAYFEKTNTTANAIAFYTALAQLIKYLEYNKATTASLADKLKNIVLVADKNEKGFPNTLFGAFIESLNQSDQQFEAKLAEFRQEMERDVRNQVTTQVQLQIAPKELELDKLKKQLEEAKIENSSLKGQIKGLSDTQTLMSKMQERQRDQKENENPANVSFSMADISMRLNQTLNSTMTIDAGSPEASLSDKLGVLRGNKAVGAYRANVINKLIDFCKEDKTVPEDKDVCAKLVLAMIIKKDSVKALLEPVAAISPRFQACVADYLNKKEAEENSVSIEDLQNVLKTKIALELFNKIKDQVTALQKIHWAFYRGKQTDTAGKIVDSKATVDAKRNANNVHYFQLNNYFPDEFVIGMRGNGGKDQCFADDIFNAIQHLKIGLAKAQQAFNPTQAMRGGVAAPLRLINTNSTSRPFLGNGAPTPTHHGANKGFAAPVPSTSAVANPSSGSTGLNLTITPQNK